MRKNSSTLTNSSNPPSLFHTPPHLSCLDVSDIDAFVLIERDGLPLSHHFHLNWGHVLEWTTDHPPVTRRSIHTLQQKGSGSSDNE